MKAITFECEASGAEEACTYSCGEAGDMTGEYYPREAVEGVLSLVSGLGSAAVLAMDEGRRRGLLDLLVLVAMGSGEHVEEARRVLAEEAADPDKEAIDSPEWWYAAAARRGT